MNVYVQFERPRDDVWGPLLGPYEWLQLTYDELRIPEDGETLAFIGTHGDWELADTAGPYKGQCYSDFVISPASEEEAERRRTESPVDYRPPDHAGFG